jgi:hypothetical protein
VLSTNIALRRDGLPLANQRQPEDCGVAVYFSRGKRQLCFACDRWVKVEDNIWAVCKTVDALRGIERWGTGDMVEAAFSGFQAIAAPPAPVGKPWWEVFGINEHATNGYVHQRYRELAMVYHPDRGGDGETMAKINAAYESFKKERDLS